MLSQCPKCSLSKSTGPMGSVLPQCQCDWKMPTAQPQQETEEWHEIVLNQKQFLDKMELLLAKTAAPPQPEQAPVAWRTFDGEGGYDYRSYEDNESYADDWNKRNPNHAGWVDKLYTHSQPEQIPVATFDEVWDSIDWDKWRMEPIRELVKMIHSKTTSPQRTWVGLTDEEMEATFIECGGKWNGDFWKIEDADFHPFLRTIEAKLKERNT